MALTLASTTSASQGVIGFFGGTGSAEGQFTQASGLGGIAVNISGTGGANPGDLYVVDPGNNRVQQFSSNGTFVRAFGADVGGAGVNVCTASCVAASASSGASGMSDPQGIAIDQATGQLFITDRGNRRIDIFSATGVFEGAFGWGVDTGASAFEFCTVASTCQAPAAAGGGAGRFATSIGHLAINPTNGNLLVADSGNHRVDEFEVSGSPTTTASFIRAYGYNVVASGPDEAGAGFEICDFAANPTDACQPGTEGSAGGQFAFNSPRRVAIDNAGNAYVVDSGNSRVQKFDSAGNPLANFSSASFSGAPPENVVVDPATNHVLVARPCSSTICPIAETSFEQRVLEFDSAGFLLDTHAVEAGIASINGLATGSGGTIYLSVFTAGAPGILILGSPAVPPTATIDPVDAFGATTATFAGSVNPMGLATGYHFEYSTDGSSWTKVTTSDVSAGSGSTEVLVSQSASGLQPSTLYYVRLVVTKSFGAGSATSAETTFTTAPSAPTILSTSLSGTTSSGALLAAKINPSSQTSSYRFQYGTADCASNPCLSAPAPEGKAGSGSTPVSVLYPATGLAPNTTYHFRVLATNPTGTTASADKTFHTFPTTPPHEDGAFPGLGFLPHNRAWEMVSPAEKFGADVLIDTTRFRAAQTETNLPMAAMFSSRSLLADAVNGANATDYLSQRTQEPGTQGWTTHGVFPKQDGLRPIDSLSGAEPLYVRSTADLSKAVFRSYSPLPGTPPELKKPRNLYLRTDLRSSGAGNYELLSKCSFACPAFPGTTRQSVAGASLDLSSVLFESGLALTEDAPASGAKLFKTAQGTVAYVGYIPVAPATSCAGVVPDCVPAPNSTVGPGPGGNLNNFYAPHAISNDGSRTFFTVSSGFSGSTRNLYQRDDRGTPTPADDTTFKLNASERTPEDAVQPATYWDAASNGERAFFTTKSALTEDAPTGSKDKLYAWSLAADEDGHHLTYISADQETADALEAVRGTLGTSDDGTRLYFTQEGQIVAGETVLDSDIGIYLWQAGSGVSYVGQMADEADVAAFASQLGSQVTPDGRYLLISLRQPPVPGGFDHGDCPTDVGPFSEGPRGCRELYLYSAASGVAPICVSCAPDGLAPSTPAFYSIRVYAANTVATDYLNRAITDDGHYIFFSTGERLVEADVNATTDAYVYDTSTGEPRLLSSGQSETPSYYLDSSADGHDAFIATRERLSGWDFDSNLDVYDARVNGGLPEPPPPPPAACQGDSCQAPPGVLGDVVPASAKVAGRRDRMAKRRPCRPIGSRAKARGKPGCVKRRTGRDRRKGR